jgi:hypothetical protein
MAPSRKAAASDSDAQAWSGERRRMFEAQRAPLREADRTLALETRLWMLRLPPKLRPVALAEAFPRVANRLARDWSDNFMLDVCFEDLLIDRRGGRRGFPKPVLREIQRLHHFNRRHRDLIEQRMLKGSVAAGPAEAGDRLPADLLANLPVLDDDLALDWSSAETIVVTERSLDRR